jgi:hypothetical protein
MAKLRNVIPRAMRNFHRDCKRQNHFVVQDRDFDVKDLGGAIAMAGCTPHPSHESTKFSAGLSAGVHSGLFS